MGTAVTEQAPRLAALIRDSSCTVAMTGAGDRRRSIYEERAADRDHTVVALADGRLGTLDEHGTVTPLPPCCDDPVRCERPECWVPLT